MIKSILLAVLHLYQMTISPLKRPSCRFLPTCSQYTIEAITHYGAWKGSLLGVMRLLRCHPFHRGGYDPVIKQSSRR
jgi:uncharacterized protein